MIKPNLFSLQVNSDRKREAFALFQRYADSAVTLDELIKALDLFYSDMNSGFLTSTSEFEQFARKLRELSYSKPGEPILQKFISNTLSDGIVSFQDTQTGVTKFTVSKKYLNSDQKSIYRWLKILVDKMSELSICRPKVPKEIIFNMAATGLLLKKVSDDEVFKSYIHFVRLVQDGSFFGSLYEFTSIYLSSEFNIRAVEKSLSSKTFK